MDGTGPGGGFVTESEEFSYRLNYLNIPILANFYVTKGLALKAGIQPGFLIGSKLRVRSNDGRGKPPTSKTKTCSGRPTSPFPSASPIPSTTDW